VTKDKKTTDLTHLVHHAHTSPRQLVLGLLLLLLFGQPISQSASHEQQVKRDSQVRLTDRLTQAALVDFGDE
jgi:hypothetical protein